MIVVFTGPAKYNGASVLRTDLVDASVKAGHTIRGKIDQTVDFLVASKVDTAKAKAAAVMGVTVISYQEYCMELEQNGCPILKSGANPDPYVDVDMDDHVPDFTRMDWGDAL